MTLDRTGRNDPCPCGSGKKYKQCCLQNQAKADRELSAQLPAALRRGFALKQAGHETEAVNLFRQILAKLPNQPDALHALGIVALQQGRVAEAINWLRQAVKFQHNNPEFYNNLGFALHEQGTLDDALKNYRKAISLAPRYPLAHFNMHALLLQHEPDAIACLEKVVAETPNDVEALWMLGVLLERAGRQEDAGKLHARLSGRSGLLDSKLDAWDYLKQQGGIVLPIMGSMRQTFTYALNHAPKAGLVLEFGVRFGNTIRQIAELVGSGQAVHGFDSFAGLPEAWHEEAKGSYSTQGEIPSVPGHVHLHPGWFENTLPEFLQKHSGNIRLINIDCDIYSSTKTVLDLLAPRMVPGSVLVFDEYIGNQHWREDEFRAFQEAVATYGWKYEYLCFSLFTKQVAVRIK